MYNKETYRLIQQIPHISGITVDDLPQFLTRVYAKIVALKATANTKDCHIDIPKEMQRIDKFVEQLKQETLPG